MNTQENSGFITVALYVDVYGYMWKLRNAKIYQGRILSGTVEPYPNKNIDAEKCLEKLQEIIKEVSSNSIDVLKDIRWRSYGKARQNLATIE